MSWEQEVEQTKMPKELAANIDYNEKIAPELRLSMVRPVKDTRGLGLLKTLEDTRKIFAPVCSKEGGSR
ncbi:MAG: hypothetical protein O3C43_19610 [Verrucomicrobia bacterium]|nr:hypothetical protein [Verrucomicrobiota bacterium]MDA1068699.1 hypothetical protein [Verrucomicrobiota bacterium]